MKKIILIIIGLALLGGGGIFLIKNSLGTQDSQAVLKVVATPQAAVFLNNEKVGTTPLENKVAPGDYTIKLVPESAVEPKITWEEKIKLEANLLTYVNREFGESDLKSQGEVLTLEKTSGKDAQITVLSIPDGASIELDGEVKGTTPKVLQDVTPGNYELTVGSAGFLSRTVKIKTTAGYKLNTSFQLAISDATVSATPIPSVSPSATKASPKASPRLTPRSTPATVSASAKTKTSPPPKPYVEILETPTGFLRVRAEPSTGAEELARLTPGDSYSLLDEENGWYKIEYESEKEGWISSQYAKKFE